jgi:L1 cell adhesion molecule like protein
MLSEAEKSMADDDKIKKRIEAKNDLESANYHMKNSMSEERFKDKFTEEEKRKLGEIIEST